MKVGRDMQNCMGRPFFVGDYMYDNVSQVSKLHNIPRRTLTRWKDSYGWSDQEILEKLRTYKRRSYTRREDVNV